MMCYCTDGDRNLLCSGGSALHFIQLVTNHTPTPQEQISQGVELVQQLAEQFSANAQALISAVANNPGQLLQNLFTGLRDGLSRAFGKLTDPAQLIGKLLNWLGAGQTFNSLSAVVNNPSLDNLKTFFLEYAGLTWEHLRGVIQQQMGAGNYAAAEKLV